MENVTNDDHLFQIKTKEAETLLQKGSYVSHIIEEFFVIVCNHSAFNTVLLHVALDVQLKE